MKPEHKTMYPQDLEHTANFQYITYLHLQQCNNPLLQVVQTQRLKQSHIWGKKMACDRLIRWLLTDCSFYLKQFSHKSIKHNRSRRKHSTKPTLSSSASGFASLSCIPTIPLPRNSTELACPFKPFPCRDELPAPAPPACLCPEYAISQLIGAELMEITKVSVCKQQRAHLIAPAGHQPPMANAASSTLCFNNSCPPKNSFKINSEWINPQQKIVVREWIADKS